MFETLFAIPLSAWEEKLCAALFIDSRSIESQCLAPELMSRVSMVIEELNNFSSESALELCARVLQERT